jgi:hypothetical protein
VDKAQTIPAINEQKPRLFRAAVQYTRPCLSGARLRGQIDENFAQCICRCDRMREWQAQRGVAMRKIKTFRIEPGKPPRPILRAQDSGGVEAERFGVIIVHVRNRSCLCRQQILRTGDISDQVRGFQIGSAGKSAVEVGGHNGQAPE